MRVEMAETQESRSERGTVLLTAEEKRAVFSVASALGSSESEVLRNFTVAEIVADAKKRQAAQAGV